MVKLSRFLCVLMFAVFVMAGNAVGMPFDPATSASPGQLDELQRAFVGIGSTINAYGDATADEVFEFQQRYSTAQYVAKLSYSASDLEFGIYDIANRGNQLTLYTIGANSQTPYPAEEANVAFYVSSSFVASYWLPNPTQPWNSTTIDTAVFSSTFFGYYITSTYGTYFSESEFNPNEEDHFLTYPGKGEEVNLPLVPTSTGTSNDAGRMYIAAEATPWGSAGDFTDFIAQVDTVVTPVPEPATMMLLGTGLIGLAGMVRQRRSRK